jgi:predicted MFS family arabinose efflux permease
VRPSPQPESGGRDDRRALLVVLGCLVCQLALGYGYVFPPLAGFILPDFGWTRTEYFAVRVPQLLMMAAASPLLGILVARTGARRTLLASAALVAVCYLLLSRIEQLWHLYALLMLSALALVGLGDVSVGQLVTRWVRRRRGLALGVVYAGSNLAGYLLVPLWVDVAQGYHWRTTFLVMGAGAALVMVPAVFLLIRDREGELPLEVRSSEPGSGAGGAHSEPGDLDLRGALRTRTFWILAAALFVFFFYFIGVLDHLVLFLTDAGLSTEDATYYYSRALGLGLASKLLLGAISDYIPEKTSFVLDHGLLLLSSLVLIALPGEGLLWLFVASYGFSTAARDVVYPLIINRCFGERYMAEIYGALMLALPAGSLGAIFAAQVFDRLGSYDVAFATFAALNAAVVASLSFVRDERGPAAVPG